MVVEAVVPNDYLMITDLKTNAILAVTRNSNVRGCSEITAKGGWYFYLSQKN